jgi:hypothetical protein
MSTRPYDNVETASNWSEPCVGYLMLQVVGNYSCSNVIIMVKNAQISKGQKKQAQLDLLCCDPTFGCVCLHIS